MKLPRKIFAATMIVALLVMLLPQVGLAQPQSWPADSACTYLGLTAVAKWDMGSGWSWANPADAGTIGGTINGALLAGSWWSTKFAIAGLIFKDGVTSGGGYQLLGGIKFLQPTSGGTFDLSVDPDVFTPTTISPLQDPGSGPWMWLPPSPIPYVGYWPNQKAISHIEFCTDGNAVTLDSFSASAAAGQVKLVWKTAAEVDNAGFNLYRSASLDGGQLVKVNSKLIAASMEALTGASYSFVDKSGAGTFYYWLEDVSTSGVAVRHGPVKVSVKPLLRRPVYRPLGPAY